MVELTRKLSSLTAAAIVISPKARKSVKHNQRLFIFSSLFDHIIPERELSGD
jgi:hypothetical protein